jgi:hypothetical protein
MEELKYKVGIETDRIEPADLIDPSAISSLVELNAQIESYKAQLKELAQVEKEQGELSQAQKKQQEELKLALKDAQGEYRNVQKGIQNVDAAVKSSITTYDGLVKENKALMESMRNLPLNDTTGQLKKLQDQYNANNEELKKFDAELGNHQRNVGNYKSGLSGLTSSLQGLPGPIGGVVAGVKTLNTAIKANPIGLAIAAIAGLIAMLSKLQPVVDFATKQFQVLSNIVLFFVDKVGGALGLIEATDMKLGDIIRKTAELADAEVRLRDAKREQIVAISEQDKLVSELRLKAADMNLSEQERLDTLIQIEEVERETLQEKKKLAIEELRIAEERAALTHSDAATLEDIARKKAAINALDVETNNFLIRITQRRTGLEQKAIEDEKRGIEEARQARERAHKERMAKLEQEAAKEKALADQKIKAAQKLQEETELLSLSDFDKRRVLIEREFQRNIEMFKEGDEAIINAEKIKNAKLQQVMDEQNQIELDKKKVLQDKLSQLDNLRSDTLLTNLLNELEEEGRLVEAAEIKKQLRIQEIEQLYLDAGIEPYLATLKAKEQADLEYEATLKQAKEREIELEQMTQEQKLQMAHETASNFLSIGNSLFQKTKAFAVAQAIIDSLAAANSAARNTPGGVLAKSLAAAAMLAKGIANVRKILSTNVGSKSISGGGSGSAASAVSTMAVTPAGSLVNQGLSSAGFAQRMAENFTPQTDRNRDITVNANVDRRGIAIAVREGERAIRTQQFDYK